MSEIEKKKSWYTNIWVIAVVIFGLIGVILVYGYLVGNEEGPVVKETKPVEKNEVTENEIDSSELKDAVEDDEDEIFEIGDTFTFDGVKWIVEEPQKTRSISNDFNEEERDANGVFVLVNIKAEQTGKENATISTNQFGLIDNKDQRYTAINKDLEGEIEPNVPTNVYLEFDVPETAEGLMFVIAPRLSDLSDDDFSNPDLVEYKSPIYFAAVRFQSAWK